MTGDVLAPRGALRGMLLAAGIVSLWLAVAPATPDLAAQVYRVHLFANHGFALYDANWYGGHLLPAYSVLFPPLGALIGVRLAGALATAAAIVLFDRLARDEFGSRAWRGTVWFAVGAGLNLLSARLTFALGLAVGLAALLAARRGRQVPAVALAFACPLASPLAGLFLAGAGAAWALGQRRLAPGLAGRRLDRAAARPPDRLSRGWDLPLPAGRARPLADRADRRRPGAADRAAGAADWLRSLCGRRGRRLPGAEPARLQLRTPGADRGRAPAGPAPERPRALLLAAAAPLLLSGRGHRRRATSRMSAGRARVPPTTRPWRGSGATRRPSGAGRDPLHQAALGGRLRRPPFHARPRMGAPARSGQEPDLLSGPAPLARPWRLSALVAGRRGAV